MSEPISPQHRLYLLRKARHQCQKCAGVNGPLVNETHCNVCRLAFNARCRRAWRRRGGKRGAYRCSVCTSTEHNKRVCPVRAGRASAA